MKAYRYWLLVVLLLVIPAVACDIGNDNSSGSGSNPPANPPDNNPPDNPPPQTSPADLTLLGVSVEPANDVTGTFTHNLVITVRNSGGSEASGFNVSCSWQCAAGAVTQIESDYVYDGYIQAGSEFTYHEPFRDPCEVSFGSVSMTCVVDPNGAVAESNENNNVWNGTGNF